jgi:hypothetical protein
MPHPIFGPPAHELETIRLVLSLPTTRNGRLTGLTVHGGSSTKRGDLWSYRETWTAEEQRGLLEPTDMVHWIVQATAQDRPMDQATLERCLLPGGWEDVPLTF